ncbi:SDR family NAD(P)-dependent oxidoreductase [Arthrobacter sp. B2a2-09]|uniref:SDR family NAD(P)-dependent oxidoreductase n=1 Tax=Arthrobacter sp. B2a2-09 TaxID=2952822 RepID=UPI0022CDA84D|nr:SDR family NAD(P)-dependent oxidoreductase [Arthrobacter sp. B2a2-09]MCZ9882425.1 SDR family NAD(P)-dependent oxidoreductase [Arthrobacter sp. B2a2-09]
MTTSAPAWVITGPASGFGHATALELARHGTVVLVGRSPEKLATVAAEIAGRGGAAVVVVADLSDVVSSRRAAAEITALDLPIRGVLNNAGVMLSTPATSKQGWELSFATNHLGPLAFTEALIPSLADGTNVIFITSAVEDPARIPAVRAGFRGSRFISAQAAARGEYTPGGSSRPGMDAYATSKQGNLAAVFSLAREFPRLRFRAIEPGVNPGSNLGELPAAVRLIAKALAPLLTVFPHFTTSKRAAHVISRILTDSSAATGTYYDEQGKPLAASAQVSDAAFSDRYIEESRALLATVTS